MEIKKWNQEGLGRYIHLEKYGLTVFQLKMIAVISMVLDHAAIVLFPEWSFSYRICRGIGRMSFPIFAFLIVEGFFHTSSRKKYALRLGVFAVISEIPYDLAWNQKDVIWRRADLGENLWHFYFSGQNVFFTLFLGMIAIWALDCVKEGKIRYSRKFLHVIEITTLQAWTKAGIMIFACGLGYLTRCSYSYGGVFLILCFYIFHEHHVGKALTNIFFHTMLFDGNLQRYGVFSVVPIAFYSGKRGRYQWKCFFYWFYPVHLLFLAAIQAAL